MTEINESEQQNIRPDMGMVREHLELLMSDLGDMEINVRRFGGGQADSLILKSIDDVCQWIGKAGQLNGTGFYIGVCPRIHGALNGSKDGVAEVRFLWADLDAKDYKGGKEEALARIRAFPIRPTLVVDSGNGYHVYWLLASPIDVTDAAGVAEAERYLKGLATNLGADMKAAEISRVLRIPGTYNLKDPKDSKLARIVELS